MSDTSTTGIGDSESAVVVLASGAGPQRRAALVGERPSFPGSATEVAEYLSEKALQRTS